MLGLMDFIHSNYAYLHTYVVPTYGSIQFYRMTLCRLHILSINTLSIRPLFRLAKKSIKAFSAILSISQKID